MQKYIPIMRPLLPLRKMDRLLFGEEIPMEEIKPKHHNEQNERKFIVMVMLLQLSIIMENLNLEEVEHMWDDLI